VSVRAKVGLFLAGVFACSPVNDPPQSRAPTNTCPTNDCTAYKQTGVSCTIGNFCEAPSTIDPLLVVSIPESSEVAPGQTFANTYKSLLQLKLLSRGRCSATLCLPPYGESSGTYQVEPLVAKLVNFYVGPCGASGCFNYSIPTHVTLRPLWSFAPTDPRSFIDAPLAGVPLFPTFARVTFDEQAGRPGPGDPMAPNIGYDVALPSGPYERTMLPDPPFDQAYPPVTDVLQPTLFNPEQARVFTNVLLGGAAGPVAPHELTVTREGGTLEGWSVYLRDIVTERRISSRPILPEIGGKIVLFTVNQFGPSNEDIRDGVELVVSPPAALSFVPELRSSLVSNKVLDASYPALPTPVVVRGFVESTDRVRTPARIVFESTEVQPLRDASSRDLHFSTETVTTATGEYVVVIPPGKYKVIITPPSPSGLAKTLLDVVIGDTPQDQQGRSLQVLGSALLRGTCTLSDGRPLADAEVEAHAASALYLATPLTARNRARWPRTVVTRTNDAGAFALPVDPGTYDVVVRPAENTRFPWLVTPDVVVAARTATEPDPAPRELRVPVGRHLPITLHDASDLPIVHGLVRAFVGHQVPGGTVGIEVGRVRTGSSGELELFLDPDAK
jgi:hypothetical protein